ncbi:MAG: efflux RND transporter periplasmic adaptor subunit [Candidatus Paceibacterota bacterium]|jgi:HlyD family secretion protein
MFTFIRKHKTIILSATGIAILALAFATFSSGSKGAGETVVVARHDLIKTVKISGKVVATDSASLGFEIGGTVAGVYKRVGDSVSAGDVLVTLDSAALNADVLKAKADLASAQAELVRLGGSAQLDSKTAAAQATLAQAIDGAYSNADDAIRNKTDQFFTNPDTVNPEIVNAFNDTDDLEATINYQRLIVKETFDSWRAHRPDAETARKYLATISSFLNNVSRAVNIFRADGSLSQASIDKYKADVALARQNVNSSLSNLISAEDSLNQALSDVPVQQAKVSAALAMVQSLQANLSRTTIVSPISGVVSVQDAKVGQAVSPNQALVSVISRGYRIDAYVPEILIAGVSVGNAATATLDAYGSSVFFPAKMFRVDPAETIRDGVSNYKVELAFDAADERVRSGMTANVTIETFRKAGALVIPLRSVVSKDGSNSVFLKTSDDSVQKVIGLGMSDSEGNVEVLSGLVEGDSVLLNPTVAK